MCFSPALENTIERRVKEAIAVKKRKPPLNRDEGMDLPAIYNPLLASLGNTWTTFLLRNILFHIAEWSSSDGERNIRFRLKFFSGSWNFYTNLGRIVF